MKTNIHTKLKLALSVIFTLAIVVVPTGLAHAESQLITFNNPNDLSTYFTPGSSPAFTDQATGGIDNSGSVNVPLGSDDVWVAKSGYTVGGVGDVYTFSGYFHIVANSGYGDFGISSASSSNADGYGEPATGLGVAFHGGGALVQSDGSTADTYNWGHDLVLGNWYYVQFEITRTGTDTYTVSLTIDNTDSTGVVGSVFTQQSSTGVVNNSMASAITVYPFIGAGGSRIDTIDNIALTSATVLAGHPIVANNSTNNTTTGTSTTINGTVSNDQGSTVTNRGVCYGTSPNPSATGTCVNGPGSGTGNFSVVLDNLAQNTIYYVQTFATNANGTSYSTESTFTTGNSSTAAIISGTNVQNSKNNKTSDPTTPDTGYGQPNNIKPLEFLMTVAGTISIGLGLRIVSRESKKSAN